METLQTSTILLDLYEDGTSIRDVINAKISDTSHREDIDDAFYLVDLGKVVSQYKRWTRCIPRVQPFYAIKCNPNTAMLKVLAKLGAGFDCGSKGEIITALDLNVHPSNIIYANTCKQESHLQFAKQKGISLMTFDNADELVKIHRIYPDARLVLRLATDDRQAITRLSCKYGCELAQASHLFKMAKQMDLKVVGVNFHVGSASQDPNSYAEAIRAARLAFDQAKDLGFQMEVLDIGGGFPGDLLESIGPPFEKFAGVINIELEKQFPATTYPSLRLISEPGRYFAGPAFTIVMNIVARHRIDYQRTDTQEAAIIDTTSSEFRYYLNDGLYGSFLMMTLKPITLIPSLLKERMAEEPKYPSSIWGQTCDGLDFITKQCHLHKLEVGEWVFVEAIGAYSLSCSSNFNGFKTPHCFYIAPKQLSSFLQEVFESIKDNEQK